LRPSLLLGVLLTTGVAGASTLSLTATGSRGPQSVAPKLDESPFERPNVLLLLKSSTPAKAYQDMKRALTSDGFEITSESAASDEIHASRRTLPKDTTGTSPEDRVIVWLERDLATPTAVRVYGLHARYVFVKSAVSGLKRALDPGSPSSQSAPGLKAVKAYLSR
jgi:hypothetical protein